MISNRPFSIAVIRFHVSFQEIEKYKSLDFFARQVVEGFITGLHKSPFHGFSVEFAEHRLYNNGESTKNIDWKLYGRTDKLFVKRFEEETNLRCLMLIDQSSSMYFPLERHGNFSQPNKITFSVYAAALVTELLVRQRDAFGLSLFSDKVDLQTEIRSSTTHQRYIFSLLEKILSPVDADSIQHRGSAVAETLHLMAEKTHRRSLVVIFTDAFVGDNNEEPLFDALRHLRHCKHEVLLFHTLDYDKELELNFGNKPYYFIDMETDKRVKLFPHEIAERYRDEMTRQTESVRRHAMQYNIDYVPVDINRGFEQIMLPFVLKRSKHY
ncbi:MAG: DUF58 domain-containing protein [Bacteroidales bacterium]|nr:DUF58 domain-containing protein [Bacteroidales bacterium]